uniref:Uncharacterized protein n=1 Tax=Arundo donax TaxID=35708 RepID=A0A0A8ZXL3_ARUDO
MQIWTSDFYHKITIIFAEVTKTMTF